MDLTADIASVLVAIVLVVLGVAKLLRSGGVVRRMEESGVRDSRFPLLGMIELSAAVVLVIGLWVHPLSAVAASLLAAYLLASLVLQLRAPHSLITETTAFLLVVSGIAALRLLAD